MTQQEIIEMARQAGFGMPWLSHEEHQAVFAFAKLVAAKHDPKIAIADAYRAGVDSGIAAEREACAKHLDNQNTAITDILAAEIRARGEA